MPAQNPRQIAARILRRREDGEDYVETLLEAELARSEMSPADRGLCQELTYGVVRWKATLDWLITQKTKGREQKSALQVFLGLGLYQIFWLDRIPNHAAVNETVELAKRSGFSGQSGFVNAILRSYLREFEATKKLLAGLKTSQPALGHSHPEWLYERWKNRWVAEKTGQLMEWNNTPPKTFARANTLAGLRCGSAMDDRQVVPTLLELWREEGVEAKPVTRDWLPENLVFELKSHPPLSTLKSFQQGFFYMQDPGTLLAVRELDPHPGETILDLCAAPGGKTTYIAQLMHNKGRVVAQDISGERVKLIRENCERLGVACVETRGSRREEAPTSKFEMSQSLLTSAATSSQFDRILIDAPCSNTGVMRRRVDLRWRITPEEISRLQAAQLNLLERAGQQLKPGGGLVYSTCSLEPEENSEVVKRFLSEHAEFKLESERELLPFQDEVDGAFVARLRRE